VLRRNEPGGATPTRLRQMGINKIIQFTLQLQVVISCKKVFERFVL
jgi:hypothetical protein